jgi:hypothetical protein
VGVCTGFWSSSTSAKQARWMAMSLRIEHLTDLGIARLASVRAGYR